MKKGYQTDRRKSTCKVPFIFFRICSKYRFGAFAAGGRCVLRPQGRLHTNSHLTNDFPYAILTVLIRLVQLGEEEHDAFVCFRGRAVLLLGAVLIALLNR